MAAATAWSLTTAWLAKSSSKAKSYGSSSIQGRRPNQEDRFCIEPSMPGHHGCGFYAVYDGHGGHRAASFAAEKMHGFLTRTKAFKGRDLLTALQQAFHDCETEFIQIAGREGLRDGTTAIVALVQDDVLTVAHVGDSRGVLCRKGGTTIAITQDHKPELEPEKKRIEALGGFVSYIGCWRAMGILAMSRAIGDLFLKPYVSAEPDVNVWALEATDEFVVLASDGVFDVFDNEQVVRIARSAGSPQEAATLLTSSAFHAGSLDNVTAIVVALRGYQPVGGGLTVAASVAEASAGSGSLISSMWNEQRGLSMRGDAARSAASGSSVVVCSGDASGQMQQGKSLAYDGTHGWRGVQDERCASCSASASSPSSAAVTTHSSALVATMRGAPTSGAAAGPVWRLEHSLRHAVWLDLVAH